jgi:hypothetical protein
MAALWQPNRPASSYGGSVLPTTARLRASSDTLAQISVVVICRCPNARCTRYRSPVLRYSRVANVCRREWIEKGRVMQKVQGHPLMAETKPGSMLAATGRTQGARAGGQEESPRGNCIALRDSTPTLAELGMTKRESAEAQRLAAPRDQTTWTARLTASSSTFA